TLIDFQIKFSISIGETVTHWFTLIVLSALRRSDNENMLSVMNLILMSILTDLQVTPTKPGRMTNPYSSHRFIANCFIAGNFKMGVKKSDFAWTEEAKRALKDMKKKIAELPTSIAPIEGETLIMYLSATEEAISDVLLAEQGDRQMPIYFVGRALKSSKVNYNPMEKLSLALVHAIRRLRRGRNQVEEAAASEEVAEIWKLFTDTASINKAEYEALLAGLRITKSMRVKHIEAFMDSKLVANQINNLYQAKEDTMQLYLNKAKDLTTRFMSFLITQVQRSQNKQADALRKMASVMTTMEEDSDTWMTPIKDYLEKRTLPKEKERARWLKIRAKKYLMLEGTLYWNLFLGPWLRCVGPEQANYVIREIHEGSCNMYLGPWSVVAKAMQLGYYWLTRHVDARMVI
nr:reverse transcriptase domain-containing protein [Tanacetum cinerariifolium]